MISRTAHVVVVVAAIAATVFVVRLIRTRRLKGKYSVLWMGLSTIQLLVAVFPGIAVRAASILGVQTPLNAVFLAVTAVLALVVVDLSWELSKVEDRTRRLAEDAALLRLRLLERDRSSEEPDRRQEGVGQGDGRDGDQPASRPEGRGDGEDAR